VNFLCLAAQRKVFRLLSGGSLFCMLSFFHCLVEFVSFVFVFWLVFNWFYFTGVVVMFPFHLAVPVKSIADSVVFYVDLLGCEVGRQAERWCDLNFYGHQLSLHLKPEAFASEVLCNPVDGKEVPVRHFGVVLSWEVWHVLADKLRAAECEFVIEPYVRFEGEVGEQATMFFLDPSGNALEFKSFKDPKQLFTVNA